MCSRTLPWSGSRRTPRRRTSPSSARWRRPASPGRACSAASSSATGSGATASPTACCATTSASPEPSPLNPDIAIRDAKKPNGPALLLPAEAWQAFIARVTEI
ncbi:DUF397 domain-containing protein [Streptomyces sp. NPDC054833]